MPTKQFQSDPALLPELQAFVRQSALAAGLSTQECTRLHICVEEIFLNICQHAYQDSVGLVCVAVHKKRRFHVLFTDYGPAFDPTRHPAPDLTVTSAQRPMGGLGIFMVKRYMHKMRYQRKGRKNSLELTV